MFDKYDEDDSGAIEEKEVQKLVRELGMKLKKKEWKEVEESLGIVEQLSSASETFLRRTEAFDASWRAAETIS
eukprot:SAG11_NODE_24387_length_374_cov_0.647273_1_plen_72_part_01